MAGLVDRVAGATADPLAPGSDGVRDHFMNAYLARLEAAEQGRPLPSQARSRRAAVAGSLP
ncbi:hypothetical protein [Nonomuraea sp. NPDC049725]|uniref:hypothetical protein n=1 Tax=Nonomuraea sp. NPDC049725 TaxID=3154508 RepID=UPI003413BF2F